MTFQKTMFLHPRIQRFINSKENKGTQVIYSSNLNAFQKYCEQQYKSVDKALNLLLKNKVNKYDFIINFKNHPLNSNVVQGVKKGRVNTAVNFVEWDLKQNDFEFNRRKLNQFLGWGRKKGVDKGELDRGTVIKILQNCTTPRLKAFLHLLAAIGCRPKKEACGLRVKDVIFDAPQPYIHFPANITKTNVERNTFMTHELVDVLKTWLKHKTRERNKVVFDDKGNYVETVRYKPELDPEEILFAVNKQEVVDAGKKSKSIYFHINREFQQLLKDLKLDKRNDLNRRQITFKTLRDFVYSEIEPLGHEYAEFHLGHSNSTYWRKKLDAKIQAFRNVELSLTYLSADSIGATTQDLYSQNRLLRDEVIETKKKLAILEKAVRDKWIKDSKEVINPIADE